MGQKTNPVILRLNKTINNWESKYFEKKSTETAVLNYKDIEIRKFIHRFFNHYGLTIHKLKLSYHDNRLHIFLSYFSTLKTTSLINLNNKSQKIKVTPKKINETNLKQKYTHIKNKSKKYIRYEELNYQKKIKTKFFNKLQLIVNKEKQTSKFRRIPFLKYYKNYRLTQKYENVSNVKTHSFLNKFFESLKEFTSNVITISITLNKLNNNIKRNVRKEELKVLKKRLVTLRRYKNNEFFKEGVNIMFLATTQKNSAELLSQFIANQLQKLKRHNFFLRFIKSTLILFNNNTFSKMKGIKIKIKGRFNRAPRARHKIIEIGNGVPALTIKSKISYAESVAFTSNGTFGVKVWIDQKKKYYVHWTKAN